MATRRTGHTDDIHAVAETFLREYLVENGGITHVPVVSTRSRVVETRQAAEEFVTQLRKTRREARAQEATRYEIEEPKQMILARRSGNVTSFFYGWKAQRPLFTHAKHFGASDRS